MLITFHIHLLLLPILLFLVRIDKGESSGAFMLHEHDLSGRAHEGADEIVSSIRIEVPTFNQQFVVWQQHFLYKLILLFLFFCEKRGEYQID
jgi:hypothetical protein